MDYICSYTIAECTLCVAGAFHVVMAVVGVVLTEPLNGLYM
jgi:hypothetical protein